VSKTKLLNKGYNYSLFYLVCFILISLSTFSQEKKPKVALVLSGGGAKGIAHIPLLQKLDSLGIVPDLIVGTSMGSVVGGLYAAGYSGDSIAKITRSADWSILLGGEVSLRNVSVEEKSEFGRYLVNLDVIDGKPKVKSALLKDQNLREFLSSLLYPVYDINDFDNLPIPFRSMTTDLVNGKEVILSEGSLGLAIRASMSIPSVFEPVKYKSTLLVDGGVLNNFPTDVAKRLGADIIIGSDVGGGLAPIEKLDNMATILFQTSMLTSNIKNPGKRALCDILINHYPYVTYSTQDFNKGNEIYSQGKIATKEGSLELEELAIQLKQFSQRKHELPNIKDEIVFDKIEYLNISPENLSFMKARMAIESGVVYSSKDLVKAVDRAMGSELFYQITYKVKITEDEKVLVLIGHEKSHNQISGALHYDTNQGVGLIVNYTGRNILGYSSRLLLGLDIAEQPKFRMQYQQNIGDSKSWWWRAQVFGQKTKQGFYSLGIKGDELKNIHFKSNVQFNKNLNSLYNYVGIDLNYEYTKIKPALTPSVNNNIYDLNRYNSHNYEVSAYFYHNNFDKVFFPTKGAYFYGRAARSLYMDANVEYNEFSQFNESGETNGYFKVNGEYEKRIPIKNVFSLVLGMNFGFIFIDNQKANELSFIDNGFGAKYYLGGNLIQNRRDSYVFNGLKDSELITTQFIKTNIALQINPFRNIYITPYLNFASVGFGDTDEYFDSIFNADGNWIDTSTPSFLFSAGTAFSYNSILGPVSFDVSYLNNENKLNLFFSVGLRLSIPK